MCGKRVGNSLKYLKTTYFIVIWSFLSYFFMFLTSQSYDFDTIAHAEAPLSVEMLD